MGACLTCWLSLNKPAPTSLIVITALMYFYGWLILIVSFCLYLTRLYLPSYLHWSAFAFFLAYTIFIPNRCFTKTFLRLKFYAAFLVVLILCQIGYGSYLIAAQLSNKEITKYAETMYYDEIIHSTNDVQSSKSYVTSTELKNKCCGLYGHQDYDALKADIPPSCCGYSDETTCDNATSYTEGCLEAAKSIVKCRIGAMTGLIMWFTFALAAFVYVVLKLVEGEPF